MSSGSHRKRAAAVVAAVRGQGLLPVAPSCVPTVGRHSEYFLVPAHYHETRGGLDERHPWVATALDAEGNEAFVLASQRNLTRVARRMFGRAGLPAPKREFQPIVVPEETWAAYERLVPEEWMRSLGAQGVEVYAVSGAMPSGLLATIPVVGGVATVTLAPRVASLLSPCLGDPMFRLALRDVVRVQTLEDFEQETLTSDSAEDGSS